MKKIISVLLIFAMILGLCVTTQAAKISPEGRTIDGWNNWRVISGTAVTTRVDPQRTIWRRTFFGTFFLNSI